MMVRAITNAQQWERIEDLFERALGVPQHEREVFLAKACAGDAVLLEQLLGLITAHGSSGVLDELSLRLEADMEAALPATADHGSHIGSYRVVSRIGSGGMGVVYLAAREGEGFRQRAAIKVLKTALLSDASGLVPRFLAERSILSRLEHPNIPRFLDGGITESGAPYFAMEYVQGAPIDRYCDERRLSVRDRLSLFVFVCDAMQYAHQHLVVHRDLKPSNILVTDDGVPKVLDFGIAKILDVPEADRLHTGAGERWMTSDYASPEQIRGEPVTTAADVFALGVVLYELLVGARPHAGATRHEVEHAVLETDPPRPSMAVADAGAETRGASVRRVRAELAVDLDTIALKALSKSPKRRYSTAGALGDDIRRHLAGLPVHASPDTFAYRARKFVARHQMLVAALVVAAASLVAGTVATTLAARRATANAALAELERGRAEQVSRFAVGLFAGADPFGSGHRDVTARELLDSGAAKLRRELIDQPEQRATMLGVLAESYQGLGRFEDANAVAAEAVALRRAEHPVQAPELASALERQARVFISRNLPDSAGPLAREALALRRASGASAEQMGTTLTLLGDYFHGASNLDSAEHYLRQAVAGFGAVRDTALLADMLTSLSLIQSQRGQLAEAESTQLRVLALMEATYPKDHPMIANSLGAVAVTRFFQGNVKQARADVRRGFEMISRSLGPRHPEVANDMHHMGYLAAADGDLDSAAVWFARAAALREELNGPKHVTVAYSLSRLGNTRRRQGDAAAAEPVQRRAAAIVREQLPPGNPERVSVELDFAVTLIARKKYREAESVLVAVKGALAGRAGAEARVRQADSLLRSVRGGGARGGRSR